MEKHIKILAILYLVFGALGLLTALGLFFALVSGGWLSGRWEMIYANYTIGVIVTLLLALLAAANVVGGLGLLQHYAWARLLVLILGCLNLFSFPLGTALGIYTLWVLARPEARTLVS